ncbi:MAG: metallophosphoesterase [Fibrobacterales bacterium]
MARLKSLCFVIMCTVSAFADFTIVTQPNIPSLDWAPENQQSNDALYSVINFKDSLNVQFVVSLGDYTDGGYDSTSSHESWSIARHFIDTIMNAHIPYAVAAGNHDMDSVPAMGLPLPFERFKEYFPISDFESEPYFGGAFQNMSNSYYLFTADSMDFIILSLQNNHESAYDRTVADWANSVLDSHSHRRAIILTHFLDTQSNYMSQIIKKHDNIFLTLAGHDCSEDREQLWLSNTPSGNPIYNIRAEYECDDEIEGIPLRYYTFKPNENSIEAYTYNTKDSLLLDDADYHFSLEYDMSLKSIPTISKVLQYPQLARRDSSVEVSTWVTGAIDSVLVSIHWGLSSGNLNQTIAMVNDGQCFKGSIPGQPLGRTIYYTTEAIDDNGDRGVSEEYSVTIEPILYTWNSWNIRMSEEDRAQGIMGTGTDKAVMEFYESADDDGVEKSYLYFRYFPVTHGQAFNEVQKFWTPAGDYPYAGISLTPRQGEEPKPHGVLDFQMHPPSNHHLAVSSFIVPKNGIYMVSNLGIRRVYDDGENSVSLLLINNEVETISRVSSTDPEWTYDNTVYDLGVLLEGDTFFFAVDNDDIYDHDAAEVSWSIHLIGSEEEIDDLSHETSSDDYSSSSKVGESSIVRESSSSNKTESSFLSSSSLGLSSDTEESSQVEKSSNEAESSYEEQLSEVEESSYDEGAWYSSSSSEGTAEVIDEEDKSVPIHISFSPYSEHFHYSSSDKIIHLIAPENIRAILIVGIDGTVQSLYGDHIDLSQFTMSARYLLIETTKNRHFVYSLLSE